MAAGDGNRTRQERVATLFNGFEDRAGHQPREPRRRPDGSSGMRDSTRLPLFVAPSGGILGAVGSYTLGDAARILKVTPGRLRYWERTAIVRLRDGLHDERFATGEGARTSPSPSFEFKDLVCAKAVIGLIEQGVPLRRIRSSVERLRQNVPELEEPLDFGTYAVSFTNDWTVDPNANMYEGVQVRFYIEAVPAPAEPPSDRPTDCEKARP